MKEKPNQLYAFFIVDIDTFKQANDLYGHIFGDTVIEKFTRSLRSQFREQGTLSVGSAAMSLRCLFPSRISAG